jgi:hypothetical protein
MSDAANLPQPAAGAQAPCGRGFSRDIKLAFFRVLTPVGPTINLPSDSPTRRQATNFPPCPSSRHIPHAATIKQQMRPKPTHNFLREHALGLASIAITAAWIVLYSVSDDSKHLGSFFGNAVADWLGVVVTVFATKYLYELGSSESRQPPRNPPLQRLLRPIWTFLVDHSLSIFLLLTGAAWVALYVSVDSESKWGQVVGNIVSEWTQIFGLVLLTKKLMEKRSKESEK